MRINDHKDVRAAIASYIKAQFDGAVVYEKSVWQLDINAAVGEVSDPGLNMLRVVLTPSDTPSGTPIQEWSHTQSVTGLSAAKGDTVTIKIKDGEIGNLTKAGGDNNNDAAHVIANKIKDNSIGYLNVYWYLNPEV